MRTPRPRSTSMGSSCPATRATPRRCLMRFLASRTEGNGPSPDPHRPRLPLLHPRPHRATRKSVHHQRTGAPHWVSSPFGGKETRWPPAQPLRCWRSDAMMAPCQQSRRTGSAIPSICFIAFTSTPIRRWPSPRLWRAACTASLGGSRVASGAPQRPISSGRDRLRSACTGRRSSTAVWPRMRGR